MYITVSTSPQEFRIEDVRDIAMRETDAAPVLIRDDLVQDAHGVIIGRPRRLDISLNDGTFSEADVMQAYQETRKALRDIYGEKVVLFRADAPTHHPNTRTVLMADRATVVSHYPTERDVKRYVIPVNDVLAVFAVQNGYYECVVRKQNEVSTSKGVRVSGEFGWGWELECIADANQYDWDVMAAFETIEKLWFPTGMFGTKNDAAFDDSIIDFGDDLPFEFRSAVVPVSIGTIQRFNKLLDQLPNLDIRTNHSCGLHIHWSFPRMTTNDLRWILFGIASTPAFVELVTKLEQINLHNDKYASINLLKTLGTLLDEFSGQGPSDRVKTQLIDVLQVNDVINNPYKFKVFRIHPQGTLEWRGPRSFLDTPDRSINKKFCHRVFEVTRMLIRILSLSSIRGVSRRQFDAIF